MRRLYSAQGLVGSIICAWLSAGSLDAKPAAPSENVPERFAIACTDKLPRLTCDSGTIWQIVPHTQLQTALVPAGAEVMVVTKTEIHSNTVVVGERLALEVIRDVIVNDRIVIAKGAAVEAVVTLAVPPRSFGRGGKLDIRVETVTAVDGQKIKLRAALNEKGKGQVGLSIFSAILLGPFGGGAEKGPNARIKAGTEIKAETAEEKAVSVDPSQPRTQDQDKISKPGS